MVYGAWNGPTFAVDCTLEGKCLPKTGDWVHDIEIILGLLLLGISIDLLSKIFTVTFCIITLGNTLCHCSFVFRYFLTRHKVRWRTLRFGLGIGLMIYGVSLIVGGLMGNDSFSQPLKINRLNANTFQKVNHLEDLNRLIKKAKKHNKPVLVDFYASWCSYCKLMDKTLFADPEVMEAIENFEKIKADVSQGGKEAHKMLAYYGVIAPPVLLFFNKKGELLDEYRLEGKVKKDKLLEIISLIKGTVASYRKKGFLSLSSEMN
jgi:thioredoxin:protein disulfide reductase